MQIDAVCVALPDFNQGIANRLALRVENAAAEMRDLTHRWADRVVDDQQIVVSIQRQLVRVERPLGLTGRLQEIGEYARRAKGSNPQRNAGHKTSAIE